MAKKLHKRLSQLGGLQLLAAGLGDDQHDLGPDFVIDTWLQSFWSLALQLHPLPPGLEPISKEVLPSPKYRIRWLDDVDNGVETADTIPSEYTLCPVISCDRQTPDQHFQDVRLLRLDTSAVTDTDQLRYTPGDVAEVRPSNLQDNVDTFFKLFPKLDPNRKFLLTPTNPKTALPPTELLPRPCSLGHAVQHYLDIQSIPRRYFFELLTHFTTDELEKEKFEEFTRADGQQELWDYCNRPRWVTIYFSQPQNIFI